jgi:hypothetical protein
MNKLKIFIPVFMLMMILFQSVSSQVFTLEYNDSFKSLRIQSEQVRIQSDFIPPSIQPAVLEGDWKHGGRMVVYDQLSGIPGQRTSDLYKNGDIELERQVWVSDDNKVIALRQKLSNLSKESFRLNSMVPLHCKGGEGFQLPKNPEAKNWNINVQKRMKNDFPVSLKPDGNTLFIADPVFSVAVQPDPQGQCLFVGYLDWSKHLATIDMAFGDERGKIGVGYLIANCEFNSVVVPPGGERTTQWLYITVGQNFVDGMDEYADRVAKYHNIPVPPQDAPTLYCSWYWYGLNYTEEYLLRDLQALKNLSIRKPFDVFLIDESWGLQLWGDFMPNKLFPSGMKFAADKIKELGYIPGIWTPPFLVSPTSDLVRNHPEWVLKTSLGENHIFRMNDKEHWIIDPTYPGVLEHLEESFRKLSEDWGFRYFKFDFMRAVFLDGDYSFYDPHVNRLEAYRMGLEAIRRGVGSDAYISVCGGHYGGSLGIANSQRSGSDVVSFWDAKEVPKFRQNILRTWMNRLWQVDPDAMMVRRNDIPEFEGSHAKLSLGQFTDNEARVNALNQYIGGGLVTFTENYESLDADRLELYKHIIPSVNSSSFPIDWYDPMLPSVMVTQIDPLCQDIENWNTIALVNWTDQLKTISFTLDEQVLKSLSGDDFLLFEFFSQEVKGLYKRGQRVEMGELDPRSSLQIKIIPWDGKKPVLAGTDLHFSMGGVEIREWKYDIDSVEGIIETDWLYPVTITTVFPSKNLGYKTKSIILEPNQKRFWVESDDL